MKLPATIQHGITVDMDVQNGEAVVHLKGVDGGIRPFVIRLSEQDLDLLGDALQEARKKYG